ncbi:GNAT family N-acetyltransferase [Frankia sp. AgB32]|uniref:GNAT family N-acetyltransferase n=1 Tax=Frankia sp. AgB32 TaxID=631119 RepID=UPI00200C4523|nr:GNAT family N-acetyltransferase [Frankia sp. AgB32]MCK9894961.1 GNAT family N-acetyltransferase [Frankia sp. AgB32]
MIDELPDGLVWRHPDVEDHLRVLAVMDDWWAVFGGADGSRQRALLLPRLFFQHFTDSSWLVEHGDGRIAAFLIAFVSPSQPDTAYVHFVGVDPALRRRGVAVDLYRRFFRLAATRGATRVRCITSPGNAASLAFHTGIGFRVDPGDLTIDGVAVQGDYDGPGLHRVAFTRTLTDPAPTPPAAIRDVRVCFVGDSFVAGTGDPTGLGWVGRLTARTRTRGLHLTAYNLGIGGNTSTQILARWRQECLPRLSGAPEPRLVLSFGVNDMTSDGHGVRVAPDRSVANLAALLTDARAILPVLMVGPAPAGNPGRDARVAALDERYADVCAAHGVPYVPVFAALRAQPSWQHEIAAGDGAHPAAAGYEQLTGLVAATWQRWLAPA